MTKILIALRTKQNVLITNCKFLKQRSTVRKWFKRTQVTKYMRNRSKKLGKEWNLKIMRTVFEAIREDNCNDRKFARKLTQVAQRILNLDMAKAFQHWLHEAKHCRAWTWHQKIKESRKTALEQRQYRANMAWTKMTTENGKTFSRYVKTKKNKPKSLWWQNMSNFLKKTFDPFLSDTSLEVSKINVFWANALSQHESHWPTPAISKPSREQENQKLTFGHFAATAAAQRWPLLCSRGGGAAPAPAAAAADFVVTVAVRRRLREIICPQPRPQTSWWRRLRETIWTSQGFEDDTKKTENGATTV